MNQLSSSSSSLLLLILFRLSNPQREREGGMVVLVVMSSWGEVLPLCLSLLADIHTPTAEVHTLGTFLSGLTPALLTLALKLTTLLGTTDDGVA